MRYVKENGKLRLEVDSFGAEIKSVRSKETGEEYMWCGDKQFWGRTSPVLFPFVGSLKNKEYVYQGKHYPMGQHGFARDMEHELAEESDTELWFVLRSTDETMKKYPFPFELRIGYELKDNQVKVMWRVKNTGEGKMFFSIGAHPAFPCPIHGEADKSGYSIYFGGVEEIRHHGNTLDTGLAVKEDLILSLKDGLVDITPDFFDRCTYMIEGNQTGEVALVDPDGRHYVTVRFDTPLFAVWSPEKKNAPFVCIEPWYGRCDGVDFEGTLEEREYTNMLTVGESFQAEYTMSFS